MWYYLVSRDENMKLIWNPQIRNALHHGLKSVLQAWHQHWHSDHVFREAEEKVISITTFIRRVNLELKSGVEWDQITITCTICRHNRRKWASNEKACQSTCCKGLLPAWKQVQGLKPGLIIWWPLRFPRSRLKWGWSSFAEREQMNGLCLASEGTDRVGILDASIFRFPSLGGFGRQTVWSFWECWIFPRTARKK